MTEFDSGSVMASITASVQEVERKDRYAYVVVYVGTIFAFLNALVTLLRQWATTEVVPRFNKPPSPKVVQEKQN